ncbi:MAG: aconitase X catalytic domain-containing protein [Pseudomonadota bacterium]
MELSNADKAALAGAKGPGAAMAHRIVVEAGQLLGADRLIDIQSAHIDGALYHGDAGVAFAERLVNEGARVAVPATLNIGALDLIHPGRVSLPAHERAMAGRLMAAYQVMGCKPTFTCAPYQAGHRPAFGAQVAWGESNAVAFCNAVLGARTNRYGDFLDIACAIAGRAPEYGLHLTCARAATLLFDASALPERLKASDVFWPVLGALVGARAGEAVPAVAGVGAFAREDRLKAFAAAAAATGAVGHFHIIGHTPEAPTQDAAFQGAAPHETIPLTPADLRESRDRLTTAAGNTVNAVGIGSPHLSPPECRALLAALNGRTLTLPLYANTGRHVVAALEAEGTIAALEAAGVTMVLDTCIVATPILPGATGVLMTNSAKFANYAPANIGHSVLFGSLEECVETAVSGRLHRDPDLWR